MKHRQTYRQWTALIVTAVIMSFVAGPQAFAQNLKQTLAQSQAGIDSLHTTSQSL